MVSEVVAPAIASGEVSFSESLFLGNFLNQIWAFVSDKLFSIKKQVRWRANKVHLHFWQAPASTTRGTQSHLQ